MAARKQQKQTVSAEVVVERDAFDVSPKVVIPVLGQLLVVVALWVATGEYNQEELVVSVSALINAVLGYEAKDDEIAEVELEV